LRSAGQKSATHEHRGLTAVRTSRGLASVLARNIEALQQRRKEDEAAATSEDRLAATITRLAGNMRFIYAHLAIVGLWAAWNAGWLPGLAPFDPSFVILATTASVEAIFLSTFVLISQNRSAAAADRRADLDLQINLLTEHEVTRIMTLATAIAAHLGLKEAHDPRLDELKRDVKPEAVLEELEEQEEEGAAAMADGEPTAPGRRA
jgi:uncharacterized membrane protein